MRLNSGVLIRGRFRLERQLGSGGHSSVWLAMDEAVENERVALKFLDPALCMRPRVLERFEREGRVLSTLSHPAIAKVLSYSPEREQPFITMEYVKGTTLSSFVARASSEGSMLSLERISTIVEGIAAAVAYAHRAGVIHRDLKPSNVMLEERAGGAFQVKVLDFGIAKVLDIEPSESTTIGRALGTPLYAAPEQQAGIKVDERADVFGLGAILFELLTLRRAFGRNEKGEPLEAHRELACGPNRAAEVASRMTEPRPTPGTFRRDINDALESLVARSLALRAADRPPSIEAMLGAFREAFGGQTIDASMLEALRALPKRTNVAATPAPAPAPRDTAPPRDSVLPSSGEVPATVVRAPEEDPPKPEPFSLPRGTLPLVVFFLLLSFFVTLYFKLAS